MKIRSRQIKSMLFYLAILSITLSVYFVDSIYSDSKVLITNMVIIVLSLLFMIMGDKYNYSLNKMFMLFSFFFFGIAPILQYQKGAVMWRGSFFSSDSYFKMNVIIILILLVYQALYFLFGKVTTSKYQKKKEKKQINLQFSKNKLLALALLSTIVTLYYNNFSLINLFLRAGGELDRVSINQSVGLIYSYFIRPIPIIALMLFKINKIKDKKLEVLLFALVLFTNFPTSRARFYVAAIYIPIMILYIRQFNTKYLLLTKTILAGFLIVFPFLDQARRVSNFREFKFGLDFQMFLEGHFDSYQMFMRVIEEQYISWGSQLFTSLFFFVPRSIWPEKSIGSGALIADKVGLSFQNISMNYFGEGYINFGYFGIFIFVSILAFINVKFDKKYWYNFHNHGNISPYYLFLLGLEFFILRGDLLSSFAFTVGLLTSVYAVKKVAAKKINGDNVRL